MSKKELQETGHTNHSKNVIRLGWVSFLTDVSSEMLYAITPLFLTTILGASMSILGLIEGIAEGTASVLKGVSGWHSDRIRKRKIFIFGGYGLSALAKPLLALAMGWPAVLFARFIDRFGKGLRTTARDALIADSIGPERRGWAFGLHRAMDTLGAFVGVSLSLLLLYMLSNQGSQESAFRLLYWIAFIPGVLGVMMILWVKEIPPRKKEQTRRTQTQQAVSLRFGKRYYSILTVFSVFALANSSDTFLLLRAKNLGFSVVAVILVYLCYNASYSLLSYPIGKLADRIPKERLLWIGFLVYAAVYLGFAVCGANWLVWLLFAFYGVYIALTEGVSKALISNLVGSEVRGTALGLFNMVTGVLALLASVIAGLLWDSISPSAPFYFGAALAVVAAVGFLFIPAHHPEGG
jgi:MFS family permease